MIAPISAPKIDLRGDHVGRDDALADRLGDVQAEEQEGDEVEEGRPEHRDCGRSTRVETMVAIELAASCRPFRKSNSSATPIRPTSSGRLSATASMSVPASPSDVLDDDAVDLVRDVLEPVDDLFQVVVDLVADDEGHGVATPRAC